MMTEQANRHVVERLWQAFDARDFDGAGASYHEEAIVEWPLSRERIRGRANIVAVNRNYPGEWTITIRRIVVEGDQAASEVEVLIDGRSEIALSFYDFRDGRIIRETDWWPEPTPYAAPAGRAEWVESMEGEVNVGS
jgi:ketosteroid isomerase-like protein